MGVFRRAFKRTFDKKFWSFSAISLVGPIGIAVNAHHNNVLVGVVSYVLTAFVAVIGIRFLWYLTKESANVAIDRFANRVWGEVFSHVCNSVVYLTFQRGHEPKEEDLKKSLMFAINNLQNSFRIVTGNKCAVSIKIPVNPGSEHKDWEMTTLCRDKDHDFRDTMKYSKKKHLVNRNTAYLKVVNALAEGKPDYVYVNENISLSSDYESTSEGCYSDDLSYVSEIVCPIIIANSPSGVATLYDLRGFLCIDCNRPYNFGKTCHNAEVVRIVANSIHPLLNQPSNN